MITNKKNKGLHNLNLNEWISSSNSVNQTSTLYKVITNSQRDKNLNTNLIVSGINRVCDELTSLYGRNWQSVNKSRNNFMFGKRGFVEPQKRIHVIERFGIENEIFRAQWPSEKNFETGQETNTVLEFGFDTLVVERSAFGENVEKSSSGKSRAIHSARNQLRHVACLGIPFAGKFGKKFEPGFIFRQLLPQTGSALQTVVIPYMEQFVQIAYFRAPNSKRWWDLNSYGIFRCAHQLHERLKLLWLAAVKSNFIYFVVVAHINLEQHAL